MIDRPNWSDGAALPAVVDAPPAAPVPAPSGAREGASLLWNNWDGVEAPEPQTYRGDIILENVGGDREQFLARFDALPEAARVAIFEELDLSPDVRVTPASDADVKRFATTPEGAELVAAWGRTRRATSVWSHAHRAGAVADDTGGHGQGNGLV